jgi:hypothetical protein
MTTRVGNDSSHSNHLLVLWRNDLAEFQREPFTITRRKLVGPLIVREFEVRFAPGESLVASLSSTLTDPSGVLREERISGLLPDAARILAHIMLQGPLFETPRQTGPQEPATEQWGVRRGGAELYAELPKIPGDFWLLRALCEELEHVLEQQPQAG